MFKKDLGNGFFIKDISSKELEVLLKKHFEALFFNRIENSVPTPSAANEKLFVRKKEWQRFVLRLGLFYQDQIVGWHYGHASDDETYYMQNSAILPEYRNQGLYEKLLLAVLERVQEEEFQVITSLHHPNNAAVLIPKLKAGFIISGMQFHERFRSLIELRYIFDLRRRQDLCRNMGLDF